MPDSIPRAVKEGVLILVVSAVVALIVNYVRDGGISLVAERDSFRVETDAEFMVAKDAHSMFEAGSAFFVDAREARFFEAEHIEGAMNIPSPAVQVDSLAWLAPADPVVICYSSNNAQRLAGTLADKLIGIGFTKVYVLHGGIEAWKELGLPIKKRSAATDDA